MNILMFYETLLNLAFLRIDSVRLEDKKLFLGCSIHTASEQCPTCKNDCTVVNQYYEHTLCDLDISHREVYLCVKTRQFHCKNCGKYFYKSLTFAEANKSHTDRQRDFMFLVLLIFLFMINIYKLKTDVRKSKTGFLSKNLLILEYYVNNLRILCQ